MDNALDHRCAWKGLKRCCYPVKFFEPGARTGYCRYHKPEVEKPVVNHEYCEKVIEYSYRDTDEAYQLRTDFETYGTGISLVAEKIHQNMRTTKTIVQRTKISNMRWVSE